MSYILDMLIYVGMVLLDNILQYLLLIAMIDISRTCDSNVILIYNALVMFMIYPWIKIKLKVLIFPTGTNNYELGHEGLGGHCTSNRKTTFPTAPSHSRVSTPSTSSEPR
jgi:hypothetical protein